MNAAHKDTAISVHRTTMRTPGRLVEIETSRTESAGSVTVLSSRYFRVAQSREGFPPDG
jgi:hypothetical protein